MKEEAKQTNKKVAAYLKQLRQEEQLTMRSLAGLIGTQHSFIGKLETLGRRLDVGEFIHYCRAMKKDPATVLKGIIAYDAKKEAAQTKQ